MVKKRFESIQKFLDDLYSKEDYLKVISQFEKDNEFEELKNYFKDHWDTVDDHTIPDEKFQFLRFRVQQQILKQELQRTHNGWWCFLNPVSRIAAILIIPLIIASLYFFYHWRELASGEPVYAEIYCPPGTRSRFNLPDGSSGWLNSDSYLKYPVLFSGNRQVELKGEAYFDVMKKRNAPFTVSAGGVQVEALGTQFNVMAYPDCSRIEVSLEEGSVKVTEPETDLNEILFPDQRLILSLTANKASVTPGDTDYFISWKDGYLVFRNVPLSEVASRLSRWYNSEIIIQDDVLKNMPYRATFKNESLERVLSLLAMSAPISYELTESKTNNDGTYEKQKVIITYKN